MGMPWFRVNTGWEDHPKVIGLAQDVKRDGVLYVIRLWEWTARFYPNGQITATVQTIERALRWKGKGGVLVESMVGRRLLDRESDPSRQRVDGESTHFVPHDWEEHNGAAYRKWETDRNKRKQPPKPDPAPSGRALISSKPDDNPRETLGGSVGVPSPTNVTNVTNSTKNKNIQDPPAVHGAFVQEHAFRGRDDPDWEEDPRPNPPMEDVHRAEAKEGAAEPPQRTIVRPVLPPAVQKAIMRPGANAALRDAPILKYSQDDLQKAYEALKDAADVSGTWKHWDRLLIDEREDVARALREHPLASEPDPMACLLTEVTAGIRGDPFYRKPHMQKFKAIINPTNITGALNAARNTKNGIDPNAKPAPSPNADAGKIPEWKPEPFTPPDPEETRKARDKAAKDYPHLRLSPKPNPHPPVGET